LKDGVSDGIRTRDVQIHSLKTPSDTKADQSLRSAKCVESEQNTQPPRNQNPTPDEEI